VLLVVKESRHEATGENPEAPLGEMQRGSC